MSLRLRSFLDVHMHEMEHEMRTLARDGNSRRAPLGVRINVTCDEPRKRRKHPVP